MKFWGFGLIFMSKVVIRFYWLWLSLKLFIRHLLNKQSICISHMSKLKMVKMSGINKDLEFAESAYNFRNRLVSAESRTTSFFWSQSSWRTLCAEMLRLPVHSLAYQNSGKVTRQIVNKKPWTICNLTSSGNIARIILINNLISAEDGAEFPIIIFNLIITWEKLFKLTQNWF